MINPIYTKYNSYIPHAFLSMTCLRRLFLFVLFFICLPAHAFTLGDVQVNSFINQNLDANIEVSSPNKVYPDKIKAFLASKEVFKKYDLLRDSFLDNIRFSISQKGGKTYIRLTSTQTVREPLISLIVTLRSLEGNITREYNLFLNPSPDTRIKRIQIPDIVTINDLDPNENFQHKKNINAVKKLKKLAQTKAAEKKAAEKKLPKKNPFDSSSYKSANINLLLEKYPVVTTYGPIKRGTVMSLVAQKIRPNNTYSVQKIAKFLFQYNPSAFLQNDINKLKTGSILNVPDLNRPEFRKDSFAYLDQEEIQHQQSPVKEEIAKEQKADKAPIAEDTSPAIEHSEGELTLVSDDQAFIDEELTADLQESNEEAAVAQKMLQISIGEIKLLKDENKLIREQFDLLMGRMEEVINKNKLLDEELRALKESKNETNFTENNNQLDKEPVEEKGPETLKEVDVVQEPVVAQNKEETGQIDFILAKVDNIWLKVKTANVDWSFWTIVVLSLFAIVLISIVVISKWKNRRDSVQEEFSLDNALDDLESEEAGSVITDSEIKKEIVADHTPSQFKAKDKKVAGSLLETGLPDIDFSKPVAPKAKQERNFGLQLDEDALAATDDQEDNDFGLQLDNSSSTEEQTQAADNREFGLNFNDLDIPTDDDETEAFDTIDIDDLEDSPSVVDAKINEAEQYLTEDSESNVQPISTTDTETDIPKIDFSDILGPSKTSENVDLLSQSSVYFAYGKFDLAEQLLIEGIESSPENSQLKLKLFECYAKMDNEIKFMSYLEQERQLYTNDNEFNEKVKKIYLNTWDKEVL